MRVINNAFLNIVFLFKVFFAIIDPIEFCKDITKQNDGYNNSTNNASLALFIYSWGQCFLFFERRDI